MAFGLGRNLEGKKPLYIFYDCETTGRDVETDKIVEIAAVVHLASLKSETKRQFRRNASHEFVSLCFCDKELCEIAQELTGLTKKDLQDEPPLEEVLKRFFVWISEVISTTDRLERTEHAPVLVAHSGNRLDFPLLVKEKDKFHFLLEKFQQLNIRFVDTFQVFKDLKRSKASYRMQLESLSMENIYKEYFRDPYDGHRALEDARALCKIFSDAPPAEEIELFSKFTQNSEEMIFLEGQIEKFRKAAIQPPKATDILAKGITYEIMVREYKKSPGNFRIFLRDKCGIKRPMQELMEHFKSI